jgi:GT2 family glycosyltransferase
MTASPYPEGGPRATAAVTSATPRLPSVTVCIATRRRPRELALTLASIGASTYPVAQVVVSDDGDDEETRAVCRGAACPVDYVLGPGVGLGANRNRAAMVSRGDLVVFLDDDCLLLPTFLETAIGCLRSAQRRHGVGRVIVSGRELNRGHLVSAHDQTFLGFQARSYARAEGLRSIVINATVFPAAVLHEIQFDAQLVYGYDEVDFASRASAAGWVIVHCQDAINDHRPSARSREDHYRHVEASRLHVTLRRYLLTERTPLRALAFAVIAPIHVVAADVKRMGLPGVRRSAATLVLAVKMLCRARGLSGGGVTRSGAR